MWEGMLQLVLWCWHLAVSVFRCVPCRTFKKLVMDEYNERKRSETTAEDV